MKPSIATKATVTPLPPWRGRATFVRRILSMGLLLCGGYLFGAATLGGCSGPGPTWPSDGQLPDTMIQKLAECAKKGPIPLESKTYDLSFIVHVSEGEDEVRVEEVMLKDSTLQMHEVESCMADALQTMRAPLQALALRRRHLAPEGPILPESRTLLAQSETLLLLQAGGVVVVGLAAYVVIVYILEDSRHKKPRPRHKTAEPTVTAEPVATVEPLVTAAPVACVSPITTAIPTATAAPTAVPLAAPKKWEKKCAEYRQRCLGNPWQPAWNRKDFGDKKDCGACFRECKDHAEGEWPHYKCPEK